MKNFFLFAALMILVLGITVQKAHSNKDENVQAVKFTNVRILGIGTKSLSFANHKQADGERLKVWNVSDYSKILEQYRARCIEVDITMQPEKSGWRIVDVEEAMPLPPLPPIR